MATTTTTPTIKTVNVNTNRIGTNLLPFILTEDKKTNIPFHNKNISTGVVFDSEFLSNKSRNYLVIRHSLANGTQTAEVEEDIFYGLNQETIKFNSNLKFY